MQGHPTTNQFKLDASESIWFRRELEFVDAEQYQTVFADNIARSIIPTQQNIPDWASIYTWRTYTSYGKAKIVANMADDIPRVDVSGAEEAKVIKVIADAYGYDIFEIKRSIAQGTRLDVTKAATARFAVETEIDRILAVGDTEHNLNGLLTLDTVGSITPIVATTKTGGGTNWSAAALGTEIAADIFKLIRATIDKAKGSNQPTFRKFRVVMPDANFIHMATKTMNDNSGRSVLEFVRQAGADYIESIVPWYRTVGAAANGTDDRIVIFPPNPLVVAGIVPMEFTPQDPEKRNLEYVIDCVATCGGVVVRYPFAVGYMDAIDVTA